MPILLEGGCRVSGLKEGEALRFDGLRVWRHVGGLEGAKAISLRVLEFRSGLSPGLRNATCDEVLYVLEGKATVFLDGWPHEVAPEMGIYLRPGVCLTVENPGPGALTLLSSQCPDPGASVSFEPACTAPQGRGPAPIPPPFVRLCERRTEAAGDRRWYRVLVDEKVGSTQVTQFVGAIPPGRAPDHFHSYEEVLCILTGSGRMWAGTTHASIRSGSCIFLPRGQVHCVENTGSAELRLLGVFYPAGSPAVRYSPA